MRDRSRYAYTSNTMRRRISYALLASLAFASCLQAQVVLTVAGPLTARPGATINLTLSGAMSPTAPTVPTAVQWAFPVPAGYSATATIAPAAATAGRVLNCNTVTAICIEMSTASVAPIPMGPLASYALVVPDNAQPGQVNFGLGGLSAADATGSTVSATSGTAYSLTILARSDINGDGKTDGADVQAMITQILSGTCVSDQNADGKCNVSDAVLVLLKALGQ